MCVSGLFPVALWQQAARICRTAVTGMILLVMIPTPPAAADAPHRPRRIASLNLCTDQLLLMLADPETIIGLSALAQDCTNAPLCQQARHFPVLRPSAEALLSLRPDLVLGEGYTAQSALMAARSVGARVELFDPVRSLAQIPEQILRMGTLLGVPERGQALARAFNDRLAQLTAPSGEPGPVAAIYTANGYLTGRDTLPDDVLKHAGFRNIMNAEGLAGMTGLSQEALIARRPDLLVLDRSGEGVSLAQAMLDSPALSRAFPAPHRLTVPAALWLCGLPQTLDALAALDAARHALEIHR